MLSASDMENYWYYFQSLDRDLNETRLYVEHKPFRNNETGELSDNGSTFSTQFYKILFSASTEFETVSKLLCKEINPIFDEHSNIVIISKTILGRFPMIVDAEVYTASGLIRPLNAWAVSDKNKVVGLDWWRAYTTLKHNRYAVFQAANLNNATHALASLLVIDLYLTMLTQSDLRLAKSVDLKYFAIPYGPQPFYVRGTAELPGF